MYWQVMFDIMMQVLVNKLLLEFCVYQLGIELWFKVVECWGLLLYSLVVEIIEGLLMVDSVEVIEYLYEFWCVGVDIVFDDFGMGYLLFLYLKCFDIDYIKIDQLFVCSFVYDLKDIVLCSVIVSMVYVLCIKVIVEGIEIEKQKVILVVVGCDYGQGYFFCLLVLFVVFEVFVVKSQFVEIQVIWCVLF